MHGWAGQAWGASAKQLRPVNAVRESLVLLPSNKHSHASLTCIHTHTAVTVTNSLSTARATGPGIIDTANHSCLPGKCVVAFETQAAVSGSKGIAWQVHGKSSQAHEDKWTAWNCRFLALPRLAVLRVAARYCTAHGCGKLWHGIFRARPLST